MELDRRNITINTSVSLADTVGLGPTDWKVAVPPHYGEPCVPIAGCFGEPSDCNSSCPDLDLTTFRVRQGDAHDERIGWAVWDFGFDAARDTHLWVTEYQFVITEYNTTGDECTIWRCSPNNGVVDCPMQPGMNLSRLEQVGCLWQEVVGELDNMTNYSMPERCREDSFYCEFMDFLTEAGHTAYFDLAMWSLPPTSPVTVHIWVSRFKSGG